MMYYDEVANLKLVSYESTKGDARQVAREHKEMTGKKCIVINLSGKRAKRNSSDRPWQVREAQ